MMSDCMNKYKPYNAITTAITVGHDAFILPAIIPQCRPKCIPIKTKLRYEHDKWHNLANDERASILSSGKLSDMIIPENTVSRNDTSNARFITVMNILLALYLPLSSDEYHLRLST